MKSTFETLEAWKKSRELRNELSKIIKFFPSEEKFRLSDPIPALYPQITNMGEDNRFKYDRNLPQRTQRAQRK